VVSSFDGVNHDVLMARLARRIGDKRLLRIVRAFLNAGMMRGGVAIERYEGTPQGGRCHRCSPICYSTILIKSWNGGVIASVAMPTTATSTFGQRRRQNA
jgi:hypothetical protein